jgi:hypothetical protein
MILTFS